MSDPVAGEVEVPSSEPTGAVPEAPATEDNPLVTEYKNRFAGSQRSLTETQKERDRLKAEAEALRQWKAEREMADMTEVDRLKAERDAARQEAETARAEAQLAALRARFPLSAATLGNAMPTDEEALATLEAKLAPASAESEPEPRLDPNNPRRTPEAPEASEDAAWLAMDREIRSMFGD